MSLKLESATIPFPLVKLGNFFCLLCFNGVFLSMKLYFLSYVINSRMRQIRFFFFQKWVKGIKTITILVELIIFSILTKGREQRRTFNKTELFLINSNVNDIEISNSIVKKQRYTHVCEQDQLPAENCMRKKKHCRIHISLF